MNIIESSVVTLNSRGNKLTAGKKDTVLVLCEPII